MQTESRGYAIRGFLNTGTSRYYLTAANQTPDSLGTKLRSTSNFDWYTNDKYFVEGKISLEADEAYTSHNADRLDVEWTVKKILTTDYVQDALKQLEAEKARE